MKKEKNKLLCQENKISGAAVYLHVHNYVEAFLSHIKYHLGSMNIYLLYIVIFLSQLCFIYVRK